MTLILCTSSLTTLSGSASDKDFVAKSANVTFQPGETGPKYVDIDLVDDLLVEQTESFGVSLSFTSDKSIQLGDPATINILDNDGKYVISFSTTTTCYGNLLLQSF